MTNIISFPGLGIGEFKVNTVALNILGKDITWYGIIITAGIIAGFAYVMYRSKFEDLKSDDVLDYAIYCVIAAIVGARAYYVLTNLDRYDNFVDVIAIWNGGIAIYGAIIAGAIAVLIVSAIKRINPTRFFDPVGPALLIGQMIGRWGNFINAEAFGSETTLPWRMGIQNIFHHQTIYVHPTFLYESLWNLLGLLWINAVYEKKRFNGQIFLFYVTWYGFGRMFIEGLRTDSLYVGPLRISQLVGFVTFIIGFTLLIVLGIRAKIIKRDAISCADESKLTGDGISITAVNGETTTNIQNTNNDETKDKNNNSGEGNINGENN